MSVTFTKLFASITESTVWCEPDTTRLCWITMLAMADAQGRVWGSIPGLANRARVSVDAARTAIKTFLAPDPDSRTDVAEGRRIEVMEGGWRLINHAKYRALRDDESAKEAKRKYAAKKRAEEKASAEALASKVDNKVDIPIYSRSESNEVEHCRDNAEAEAEAEKEESKPKSALATRLPTDWSPSDDDFQFCTKERPDLNPQTVANGFRDYWIATPGAKGRKLDWSATWRNWVRNQKSSGGRSNYAQQGGGRKFSC